MAENDQREASERRSDEGRKSGPRRTATQARQGEIILGRRGRIVWIVAFAVLILGVVIFGW